MKAIGGFFELEIPRGSSIYHDQALALTTGRACLNAILQKVNPRKIHLPFYTCDAVLEPVLINNISFSFYSINEHLEIRTLPVLKESEYILYIDYFGIKSKYTESLIEIYGDQLIIDNTHSFFQKSYISPNYSFTSARKYFGVPDGAFLYYPKTVRFSQTYDRNLQISVLHLVNRMLGIQEEAYQEFREYEKSLNSDIQRISILSKNILSAINYDEVRITRNINFEFLKHNFKDLNRLTICSDETDAFCYPLLLDINLDKTLLFKNKIYIPSFWTDVLNRMKQNNYTFECKLSKNLLPLPIDHRYSIEDLERLCGNIKEVLNER
jgi:hypothetical protein